MNQFVQKLFPFSQWIGGGNVQQQAKESGLSFDIDVTQQGFNIDTKPLIFDGTGNIVLNPGDRSGVLNATALPIIPTFFRGIDLVVDTITILSALRVQISVQVNYGVGRTLTRNGIDSTTVSGTPILGIIEYADARVWNDSKIHVPINRYVLVQADSLEVTLSTDRVLAAGETIQTAGYVFHGHANRVPGLQIVSP